MGFLTDVVLFGTSCTHKKLFYGLQHLRKLSITNVSKLSRKDAPLSSASDNFDRETEMLFGPIRNMPNTPHLALPSHHVPSACSDNHSAIDFSRFPLTNSVTNADGIDQFDEMKAVSIKSASVGKILSETMPEDSKAALDKWRKNKIKELGEEGFMEFQNALFRKGKALHQAVFDVLSGVITLDKVHVQPENEGHWKSLQHVFHNISQPYTLEKAVKHPHLKYHGIVDCVCKLNGELVVLDWKTSAKKKRFINELYDNPVQVSAYTGAINFDSTLQHKDLCKGAVVMAYECGSPADIFSFDTKKYWKIWLQRLSVFHSSTRNINQIKIR